MHFGEMEFLVKSASPAPENRSGRRFFLKHFGIFALAVGLSAWAWAGLHYGYSAKPLNDSSESVINKELDVVDKVVKSSPSKGAAIPPIDKDAPANTETATFALG
jgi:hypothetical protein